MLLLRHIAFFEFIILIILPILSCGSDTKDSSVFGAEINKFSTMTINPDSTSQYGHIEIIIDKTDFALNPEAEIQVKVGENNCINPKVLSNRKLSCLVQSSKTLGKVGVLVQQGEQKDQRDNIFEYYPAIDKKFANFASVGGSIGAGLQSYSLSMDSQLNSVPALIAKSAGAYFPLPLISEKGAPRLPSIKDLDQINSQMDPMLSLARAQIYFGEQEDIYSLRLDKSVTTKNYSLPLHAGLNIFTSNAKSDSLDWFFDALVLHPDNTDKSIDVFSSIDKAEPEILVATYDIFDLASNADSNEIYLEEDYEKHYLELFEKLLSIESSPYIFISNMPPRNIYPLGQYSEWERYQGIWMNNALRQAVLKSNASLKTGNKIFMADLYSYLTKMLEAKDEIDIFGDTWTIEKGENNENNFLIDKNRDIQELLGFDMLEGFFTLDGKTLTNTASAIVANLMIDLINKSIGSTSEKSLLAQEIPFVNILNSLENDSLSYRQNSIQSENLDLPPVKNRADSSGLDGLDFNHQCAANWIRLDNETECPLSIMLETGGGKAPEVAPSESIELQVRVFDHSTKPVTNSIITAKAHIGTLQNEIAKTDDKGRATFKFQASSKLQPDYVYFVCGQATIKKLIEVKFPN